MNLITKEKTTLRLKQATLVRIYLTVVSVVFVFAAYFVLVPLPVKKQADKTVLTGPTAATASMIQSNRQKQAIDKVEQERLHRLMAADSIILAEVEKKQYEIVSRGDNNDFPFTRYTLKVIRSLKGGQSQNELVTVSHYGGMLNENQSQGIDNMPILDEGSVYLLFLRDQFSQTEVQNSPFVDFADGIYPIVNNHGVPVIVQHDGQRVTFESGALSITSETIPIENSLVDLSAVLQNKNNEETILSIQSLPTQENFEGLEQYECENPWIDQSAIIYPNCTFSNRCEGEQENYPDGSTMRGILETVLGEWQSASQNISLEYYDSSGDIETHPWTYDYDTDQWMPNFNDRTVMVGNMYLGDDRNGQVACNNYNGETIAAVIAMNLNITWDFGNDQSAIEYAEQHALEIAYSWDRYSGYYKKSLAHEVGHAIGLGHFDGNIQNNSQLSVMMGGSHFVPRIWDFDRYILRQKYNDTSQAQDNVFASNWKQWGCDGNSCHAVPVEQLPGRAQIGSSVLFEYTVGNSSASNQSFSLGVYMVTSLENWNDESNWTFLKSIPLSLPANSMITAWNDFIMPERSGYLMVIADYDNRISEVNENDNGQNWPRLSDILVDVNGGWLYVETGDEYGGDYNTVRLTVDSYGPPAQAELYYSTTPYDGTQAWFNQAQQANLPGNFPADYHPNDIKYLNLSGLQNDRDYSVVLRQIRNGYLEWETEYTGGISTYACTIGVSSPNGGEELLAGDPAVLSWSRSGRCTANVKIQLLRNGTACSTIAASTPNDRNHVWTANQCVGAADNYKIKVQDLGSGAFDQSDAAFTIPAHQPYDVRNQSFEWDYGTDFFPNYNLDNRTTGDLLPDGWTQSSWSAVMDFNDKHIGQYSVRLDKTENNGNRAYVAEDLPVVNGKSYRVSGWVKTACQDADCFGSIITECLKSDHSNKWTGCGLNLPEGNITRVTGFSDWQYVEFAVTADTPEAAYLRLSCYNSPNQSGSGLGTVWCDDLSVAETNQSGSLTVTRPNGGEVFDPGDSQQIIWTKSGDVGYSFKIELYQNNVFCRLIEPSASYTTYTWFPVTGCSGQAGNYKVKITSNLHPEISDMSNAVFSINPLKVTYPDDGITLTEGGSVYVLWNRADNMGENVKIELLRNGTVCRTIAESVPNVNAYTWTDIAQCNNQTANYSAKITDPTTGATATGTIFSIQDYVPPPPPDDDGSGDDPPKDEEYEQAGD